jgi:IS5 family transposase
VASLHDAEARPIAKGRLGKPVEFGYKAQLVDNEDGVIVDHNNHAARSQHFFRSKWLAA